MSYWEKVKTNKQIYTYIYIQKLDKTHTLYIDFANPTTIISKAYNEA